MKLWVLALALAAYGCAGKIAEFDDELLEKCEKLPPLEGLKGEDILKWSEVAGPLITDCSRRHNALSTAVKAAK